MSLKCRCFKSDFAQISGSQFESAELKNVEVYDSSTMSAIPYPQPYSILWRQEQQREKSQKLASRARDNYERLMEKAKLQYQVVWVQV